MLSRVAERVYWLARYIERVETTARLARVHSQLMFDLPKSVNFSWYNLVEITNNEAYFDANYDSRSETNCMTMLLSDLENPASLASSLWWARENMRTTRDMLPREAWIQINELYLMVKQNKSDFQTRNKRNKLLDQIIKQCQAWSGMLANLMGHNSTYRFLQLGTAIERADMTSRLLDEGGLFVAKAVTDSPELAYDRILWVNLLKSSGAYFMYRQQQQGEVEGQTVVDFLMHDPIFVRSIHYSMEMITRVIEKLPHSNTLLTQAIELRDQTTDKLGVLVGSNDLHERLDQIQSALSDLHKAFYEDWFSPKAYTDDAA